MPDAAAPRKRRFCAPERARPIGDFVLMTAPRSISTLS